jgi:hypothetical protein
VNTLSHLCCRCEMVRHLVGMLSSSLTYFPHTSCRIFSFTKLFILSLTFSSLSCTCYYVRAISLMYRKPVLFVNFCSVTNFRIVLFCKSFNSPILDRFSKFFLNVSFFTHSLLMRPYSLNSFSEQKSLIDIAGAQLKLNSSREAVVQTSCCRSF